MCVPFCLKFQEMIVPNPSQPAHWTVPQGGVAEPWDIGAALLKGTEPAKAQGFVLLLFLLHLRILFISLGHRMLNESRWYFYSYLWKGKLSHGGKWHDLPEVIQLWPKPQGSSKSHGHKIFQLLSIAMHVGPLVVLRVLQPTLICGLCLGVTHL